jgi:hypothetical protein
MTPSFSGLYARHNCAQKGCGGWGCEREEGRETRNGHGLRCSSKSSPFFGDKPTRQAKPFFFFVFGTPSFGLSAIHLMPSTPSPYIPSSRFPYKTLALPQPLPSLGPVQEIYLPNVGKDQKLSGTKVVRTCAILETPPNDPEPIT